MSECKWTPGPWQRSGWSVLCQSHTVVCNILPWDSSGCREEDSANAHLIAAAPELYDSLERVLALWVSGADPEELDIVVATAKVALAKAKGESR